MSDVNNVHLRRNARPLGMMLFVHASDVSDVSAPRSGMSKLVPQLEMVSEVSDVIMEMSFSSSGVMSWSESVLRLMNASNPGMPSSSRADLMVKCSS